MDLLGKKQQALENVIKAQAASITKLRNSELMLMTEIRDMDQLIFNMQQCSSFEQMRPYFTELQQAMMQHKRLESDRIQTILLPEM